MRIRFPSPLMIATESYRNWGPLPLDPATIDVVCFDVTGGVISAVSGVQRITVL